MIYPRISRRIRAVLFDGVMVPVSAMSTLFIAAKFGIQGYQAIFFAGLVVFILEPLLVAYTGGTIGHHLFGIRVVNKKSLKSINIISAIIRFVAKVIFGFFAIISMYTSKQYQAVHDSIVGSIVILKNPQEMKPYERLEERVLEEPGYQYPSAFRRGAMIIFYNLILFFILGVVLTLSVSERCNFYQQCSGIETLIAYGTTMLWVGMTVSSIILCWKARLFGCRRTKRIKE